MHRQGSGSCPFHAQEPTDEDYIAGPEIAEQAIMVTLLSDSQGLWTRSELKRELSSTPSKVQDALTALQASGLIHIHGEIVTPSRTARRMDELSV